MINSTRPQSALQDSSSSSSSPTSLQLSHQRLFIRPENSRAPSSHLLLTRHCSPTQTSSAVSKNAQRESTPSEVATESKSTPKAAVLCPPAAGFEERSPTTNPKLHPPSLGATQGAQPHSVIAGALKDKFGTPCTGLCAIKKIWEADTTPLRQRHRALSYPFFEPPSTSSSFSLPISSILCEQQTRAHSLHPNNQDLLPGSDNLIRIGGVDTEVGITTVGTRSRGIHGQTVCHNCRTDVTPLWRRDRNGLVICNACGLYFKLHGVHRPTEMRRQTIRRRRRNTSIKKNPQIGFTVCCSDRTCCGCSHPPSSSSSLSMVNNCNYSQGQNMDRHSELMLPRYYNEPLNDRCGGASINLPSPLPPLSNGGGGGSGRPEGYPDPCHHGDQQYHMPQYQKQNQNDHGSCVGNFSKENDQQLLQQRQHLHHQQKQHQQQQHQQHHQQQQNQQNRRQQPQQQDRHQQQEHEQEQLKQQHLNQQQKHQSYQYKQQQQQQQQQHPQQQQQHHPQQQQQQHHQHNQQKQQQPNHLYYRNGVAIGPTSAPPALQQPNTTQLPSLMIDKGQGQTGHYFSPDCVFAKSYAGELRRRSSLTSQMQANQIQMGHIVPRRCISGPQNLLFDMAHVNSGPPQNHEAHRSTNYQNQNRNIQYQYQIHPHRPQHHPEREPVRFPHDVATTNQKTAAASVSAIVPGRTVSTARNTNTHPGVVAFLSAKNPVTRRPLASHPDSAGGTVPSNAYREIGLRVPLENNYSDDISGIPNNRHAKNTTTKTCSVVALTPLTPIHSGSLCRGQMGPLSLPIVFAGENNGGTDRDNRRGRPGLRDSAAYAPLMTCHTLPPISSGVGGRPGTLPPLREVLSRLGECAVPYLTPLPCRLVGPLAKPLFATPARCQGGNVANFQFLHR